MSTGTLMPIPRFTGWDNSGNPLASGTLTVYLAGTTTIASVYSDVSLSVAIANPVYLNSAGRPVASQGSSTEVSVFLSPGASYKFILASSTGSIIWTQDNVSAVPASSINLDVNGTAGEALTAGQPVYLSDGSGSKTAGSWYKADSANIYSSVVPEVGIVPSSIAALASGTIRLGGQVTGLSALTIGATYYIGTSGTITATAPTLRRILGVADTTSSLILAGDPAVSISMWANDFRLTLTTGVPVTTADVTAAGTLFCTPYVGNRIDLPDASGNPVRYTSAQFSIAVPASTSQMYDVFAYGNAGVATLELLAWTSDTVRATALVSTNGRLLKTGDLTRLYIGSFRTTAVANQTENSYAKRYVWNYYNRVAVPCRVLETTASWAYSVDTFRQANAAATNQLDIVVGVAEVIMKCQAVSIATNDTGGAGTRFDVGIGQSSTTTAATGSMIAEVSFGVAAMNYQAIASLNTFPAIGRSTFVWLEKAAAVGITTWQGVTATRIQNGIFGMLSGG